MTTLNAPIRDERKTRRKIQVAVISTFRGLHTEHEYLRRSVFEDIRRRCENMELAFEEISCEPEPGRVPDAAFAEMTIRRLNELCPVVIGIMGREVSWLPNVDLHDSLLRRLADAGGAKADQLGDTNATILMALLKNPLMTKRMFLFDRAASTAVGTDGWNRDDDAGYLEELLATATASGFAVENDCHTPEEICSRVGKRLRDLIDRSLPPGTPRGFVMSEREAHRAHAERFRHVADHAREYFDQLNEHLSADTQPVVVVGPSGAGKSTLLALWSQQLEREQPDIPAVVHFVGATIGSFDPERAARRVIEELSSVSGSGGGVPLGSEEIRTELPYRLAAIRDGRVVIIIDGVDQFDGDTGLNWIPPTLPSNVRLVVSARSGPIADGLLGRGWSRLEIEEPRRAQRIDIVRRLLSESGPMSVPEFAGDGRSGHPDLRELIRHGSVQELIDGICGPLEFEFGTTSVREVLTLVRLSRRGLSRHALSAMTSVALDDIDRVVQSLAFFIWRAGDEVMFAHDSIREAIRLRYGASDESDREMHARLARHFRQAGDLPDHSQEAIGHAVLAGDHALLAAMLNDPVVVRDFVARGHGYDLVRAMVVLRQEGREIAGELVDRVRSALAVPRPDDAWITYAHDLAELLVHAGQYQYAAAILELAIAAGSGNGSDAGRTRTSLHRLAEAYRAGGEFVKGSENFGRLFKRETVGDLVDTDEGLRIVHDYAVLNYEREAYDESRACFRAILASDPFDRLLEWDPMRYALILNDYALLLLDTDELDASGMLLTRAEYLQRETGGPDHPEIATTLNSRASWYRLKGDIAAAEAAYCLCRAIRIRVLGPDHPHTLIADINITSFLHARRQFPEAEAAYAEILPRCRAVFGEHHPTYVKAMVNQAQMYVNSGRITLAESILSHARALIERFGLAETFADAFCYFAQGATAEAAGHKQLAKECFAHAARIWMRLLGPNNGLTGLAGSRSQ